jgi:NHL repeat
VTPTEHPAKPAATPKAGLLALLCDLLHLPGTGALEVSRGTGAPSRRPAASLLALALTLAAFTLIASPALAFRGHAFSKSFGSGPCEVKLPLEPCEGRFNEPAGLAVNESSGDVYVIDRGNNRVEYFTSEGAPAGEINGPSVTATGTTESGSSTITGVHVTSGAFSLGEELSAISAPGLEPGTFITAVKAGALEISQPAKAGESASLTAQQSLVFQGGELDNATSGIAVDNACHLHKPELTSTTTPTCEQFDPSNGDVYVASKNNYTHYSLTFNFIDKFTATGEYIGQLTGNSEEGAFGKVEIEGVAVDPSGNLWVTHKGLGSGNAGSGGGSGFEGQIDEFTNAADNVFSPPALYLKSELGSMIPGFAVYSQGAQNDFYVNFDQVSGVHAGSTAVQQLTSSEKTTLPDGHPGLEALYDPFERETTSGVAVDPLSGEVFLDNLGSVSALSASGVLEERFGSGVLTSGTGVAVAHLGNAVYSTVYVADMAANRVDVFTPEAASVPRVKGESVSEVTAYSTTLRAEVNPFSEPTGGLTSYRFEYGPCATLDTCATSPYESSVPVPDGELAPSYESETVTATVQGLSAGRTYHFRVRAENEISKAKGEPVVGGEVVFTTQTPGTFALPDARQWEMVSPPQKNGANIDPIDALDGGYGLVQAAASGDALVYATNTPTESGPQGYSIIVQVLAGRDGSGVWGSRDLTVPHAEATGVPLGAGSEFRFFSEDLSLAVVQPLGPFDPAISPEASEQTAFLRTNFAPGDPGAPCTSSCYRPLVTGKPGFANVPENVHFGEEGACPFTKKAFCGPVFVDATADASRIFLNAGELLPGGGGFYEWSAGKLTPSAGEPHIVRVHESGDGSWVYTESGGAVSVTHGGTTKLVAEGVDHFEGRLVVQDVRVSPDGRWLAFMSARSLTGYDNTDAVSGQADEEVYLYHAPEDLATESGTLSCASCDPTGARPHGVEYGDLNGHIGSNMQLEGGSAQWPSTTWFAANVPGWTPNSLTTALYQSRYLSDSGRLFFNARDSLVPRDVNGTGDVYEYEPEGVGPAGAVCEPAATSGSIVFKPERKAKSGVTEGAGCVGLISSGTSSGESAFLDASESGGDVFFLTKSKLAPQDFDEALDVYDAQVCTTAAPCATAATSPPACITAEGCRAAPAPQPSIFGAPGSATFSGIGNVTPASTPAKATKKTVKCRKGFVKNKKGKCVKKSKKKSKKAKKTNRRAK